MNVTLRKPRSPGPWVSEETCACGAVYRRSHYGITWRMGVEFFDASNPDETRYRSRGPVLWAMRVLKLDAWYEHHRHCRPPMEAQ
jgi:hypothetical protein